jgi:hypothetical protein
MGLHVVSAKLVYVTAVTTKIKMTADIVHIHALVCWMRRSKHATLILVNVTPHMTRNWEMKLIFRIATRFVGGIDKIWRP